MSDSEAKYFAGLLSGAAVSENAYARECYQYFLDLLLALLLSDYVSREGEAAETALLNIRKGWALALRQKHEAAIAKHTEIVEGSMMGAMLGALAGDGETIRLRCVEQLAVAKGYADRMLASVIGENTEEEPT